MSHLSDEQVTRLCQDLVYQVGYAFYDNPYLILLKLIMHYGVVKELDLAVLVGLSPIELRKYIGMLLVHRLIRRHVNKEKQPIPDAMLKPGDIDRYRSRDVIYWYMDYREFANVTKYRVAMMRKQTEEKLNSEVGQRGYVCPLDGTTYAALDLAHLFDPASNAFSCEACGTELVEQDLEDAPDGQDRMQRFNIATAPIREALRAIDGLTLPSLNIVAWIAQNVKLEVLDLGKDEGEAKRITVVVGGEGEKERIERERRAEQLRTQNALPVWHTHSTVTGSATSLGIADGKKAAAAAHERKSSASNPEADEEDMLAAHYAGLDAPLPIIKAEPGLDVEDLALGANGGFGVTMRNGHAAAQAGEEEEDEEEELRGDSSLATPAIAEKTVMVGGVPKPMDSITEEDQELMSPEEYQAYYDAALA